MKVYFDRSNRDLEDKVFGLEKERVEEVSPRAYARERQDEQEEKTRR